MLVSLPLYSFLLLGCDTDSYTPPETETNQTQEETQQEEDSREVETGEDITFHEIKEIDSDTLITDSEKEEIVEQEKEEAVSAGEKLPGGVKASPLARKLAQEKSVDLKDITGSGPSGRVVKRDIETAQAISAGTVKAVPADIAPVPVRVKDQVQKMEEEEILVSQKRRVIAKRLSESKPPAVTG